MSSYEIITWEEYRKESLEFLEISKKLNDSWTWEEKDPSIGQSFLMFSQKIVDVSNQDLVHIEYHIVYSISYQVPVMYFQAHGSDGKMISLQNIWNMFEFDKDNRFSRSEMLSILTQMEHPILFKPFMCLHPCRTAELLANTSKSRNRILTFLSIMGPYLQLNLDNRYGLEFVDVDEVTH